MVDNVIDGSPRDLVLAEGSSSADRAWIVGVAVAANAVVVVGLWFRHGQLDTVSGPGAVATAAGQLTGLVGAYVVLVQLLLMARVPWMEEHVGLDRLAVWHRWNGFAAFWLLVGHTVLITVGYAQSNHLSLVDQTRDFVDHYADVLMAYVALVLFVGVAVTSVRLARRTLRRETWYTIHLYAYLAVALGFAHQLAVGTDFTADQVARAWWVTLYVVVLGAIVGWRVAAPIRWNQRHLLRVHSIEREAPGVVSVYLSGNALDETGAQPGQFFLWRFLTHGRWFRTNPFSLSAPPTSRRLRVTVKDLGDRSHELQRLPKGTRVVAEGPYGALTADRCTRPRVLLVAGGIGITPLRAVLEPLARQADDVVLVYRASTSDEFLFADELSQLARHNGVAIHYLHGEDRREQLSRATLARLVRDVAERDVFVSGPPAMVDDVRGWLHDLGVPRRHVHFERFEF